MLALPYALIPTDNPLMPSLRVNLGAFYVHQAQEHRLLFDLVWLSDLPSPSRS